MSNPEDPNNPNGQDDADDTNAQGKVVQGPWLRVTGSTSSSEPGPSEEELNGPSRIKTGIVYGPDGVGHPTKPLHLPEENDNTEK